MRLLPPTISISCSCSFDKPGTRQHERAYVSRRHDRDDDGDDDDDDDDDDRDDEEDDDDDDDDRDGSIGFCLHAHLRRYVHMHASTN